MSAQKSKQQEKVPNKQSALKGVNFGIVTVYS